MHIWSINKIIPIKHRMFVIQNVFPSVMEWLGVPDCHSRGSDSRLRTWVLASGALLTSPEEHTGSKKCLLWLRRKPIQLRNSGRPIISISSPIVIANVRTSITIGLYCTHPSYPFVNVNAFRLTLVLQNDLLEALLLSRESQHILKHRFSCGFSQPRLA